MKLLKHILALVFLTSCMNAAIVESKDSMQIIAQHIETSIKTIKASTNVLVFSKTYNISAQKIEFNKDTKILKMYGNVNISKSDGTVTISQNAILDLKNDIKIASNILLIDNKSNIWINAKSIKKDKHINTINNAVVSSCDCVKPAWSIAFKKGEYDTKKQWISSYNNTLYIKDIPAWYFLIPAIAFVAPEQLLLTYLITNPPYIGFSTNQNRRTGLLRPLVAYSEDSGFAYYQPIYYAPSLNYDFEYIPKFQANRGYGHELKYRYINTKNSKLNISFGKYYENDKYFKENKLINNNHYGWNLDYLHNNLFSSTKSTDGLLISLQDMNDIEYKNTLFTNLDKEVSTDKIIESKIKYYYNTDKVFADINFIRYKDITPLANNNEVFQTIPQLQLHRYYGNILNEKTILSSFDIKFDSKDRKKGIGANITQINIPFNINSYFFDDFFSLDYTKNINYKNINYLNTNTYDNGNYLSHIDILTASTDLLKQYDNFIHNINFSAIYKNKHDVYTHGDIYGLNSTNLDLKPFEIVDEQDNINLSMNQNFFTNKKNDIFNHKLNQILLKENKSFILGNLENEMKLHFDSGSISNRFIYNQKEKIIINNSYSLEFKKDNIKTKIDYASILNKDDISGFYKGGISNKSVSIELSDKIYKYYTIGFNEKYDITNKTTSSRKYGLAIDRKCWNLELSYTDSLLATATTDNKALRQKILYVTITLKPIVSIKQKYIKDEREE